MKESIAFMSVAGLIRQPKWGQLKELHKAIKLCESALVATAPTITSLGQNLEVKSFPLTSSLDDARCVCLIVIEYVILHFLAYVASLFKIY